MGLPMRPYSPREVQNAIFKIENRKTPGLDKIDPVAAKLHRWALCSTSKISVNIDFY